MGLALVALDWGRCVSVVFAHFLRLCGAVVRLRWQWLVRCAPYRLVVVEICLHLVWESVTLCEVLESAALDVNGSLGLDEYHGSARQGDFNTRL